MPILYPSSFTDGCWAPQRGPKRIRGGLLAAGLGKRMEPFTTRHLPKPMFPIGGKTPIIERWLRTFVLSGISDVTMNLCVLKETIVGHFGHGERYGIRIGYAEEDTPTGTFGGACKQVLGPKAKSVFPNDPAAQVTEFKGTTVVLPSGDIVTNFGPEQLAEMYEIHRRAGAALTMVLTPVPWERRKDFGTVVLAKPQARSGIISQAGLVGAFAEKDPDSPSNLNNASIYMIETELVRRLDPLRTEASLKADNPFYDFGKHVFPALLGKLPYAQLPPDFVMWGIQYDGAWFDVGNKPDYLRVNEAVLKGEIDVQIPYAQYPWGYLGTGTVVNFDRVTIRPPVVIGNHCVIEPGAEIGPFAVIGDGWVVESHAHIRHSVLWERYPLFTGDGRVISADNRKEVDRHEVRRGVTVEGSILAGGTVTADVRDQVFSVLEDGSVEVLSIDFVPKGPRA